MHRIMSYSFRVSRFCSVSAALLAALTLVGCGSKEEETAAAPPPPPPPAEAEAAPVQEESTTESVSGSGLAAAVDVGSTMKAADTAMRNNDLVKATDSLLKLQMSGAMANNPQAKVDHYQKMIELQQRVAEAAARGDAKAQQAAHLLRQGATGMR